MGAFSLSFQHSLARESWALYGLGILVVGLRFFARIRKLGFKHIELDDYLMFLATLFYTLLIVTLNLTAQGGGSALAMPGEDVFTFTEAEVKSRMTGAKIDLVAEQAMLNVIWSLKVCMLLLYGRLTMGLRQQLGVKVISVYVAVGYLACQLTYFCECRPFRMYWQIAPSPPQNCMVLYDYLAVQGAFNITSDVFMLLIPLPLIARASVILKQKLVLLLIFSMAFFVIAAASVTKAEFFLNIYSDDYMFWYTREASVALYVANIPCIWPLLRETLPVLKSWSPGFINSSLYKRRASNGTGLTAQGRSTRTIHNSNMGLSRHSMDEFQQIVEPSSALTKSTANVHAREVHNYASRSRGGGSSDSSLDNVPFHGILAETTIEMSVMHPESVSSEHKDGDGDDVSQSSTRAFAYDVERGIPAPRR